MLQTILFGEVNGKFEINAIEKQTTLFVYEIDGRKWYRGNDIAASLLYTRPRDAVRKLVDDDDKKPLSDILGGSVVLALPQNELDSIYITFTGIVQLVCRSKKNANKTLKKFIADNIENMLWSKPPPTQPSKLDMLETCDKWIKHATYEKDWKGVQMHTNRRTNIYYMPDEPCFTVEAMITHLGYTHMISGGEKSAGIACSKAYQKKYGKMPREITNKVVYWKLRVKIYDFHDWIDFLLTVLHDCSAKYKLKAIE
jgi:prophage antirepressor-like protein